MKYWAYINNEVLGPFEKEKLKEVAGFGLSSLICPEGGQADGWKEASTIAEVRAALSAPPAKPAGPAPMTPQRMAEESPLAMTMRGTLIEMPAAAPAAGQLKPAGAPAPVAPKAEEPPLAMTMRGSIIEVPSAGTEPAPKYRPTPASSGQAAAIPGVFDKTMAASAPAGADKPPAADNALSRKDSDSQLEQLRLKVDQMSALLTSMGDSQFQLLGRLTRLENAILEIKTLLCPSPPKKD